MSQRCDQPNSELVERFADSGGALARRKIELFGNRIGKHLFFLSHQQPQQGLIDDGRLVWRRHQRHPTRFALQSDGVQNQRPANQVSPDESGQERISEIKLLSTGFLTTSMILAIQGNQRGKNAAGAFMGVGVRTCDQIDGRAVGGQFQSSLCQASRHVFQLVQIKGTAQAHSPQSY